MVSSAKHSSKPVLIKLFFIEFFYSAEFLLSLLGMSQTQAQLGMLSWTRAWALTGSNLEQNEPALWKYQLGSF